MLIVNRLDAGPFSVLKSPSWSACGLLFMLLWLPPLTTNAHPQDEDIILDIEMGELQLQSTLIDKEYEAALKRKKMRKLVSMSWQQKFSLYVEAGFLHIVPKGLDHIVFVLGLFFSSLLLASLLWQVTAFTLAHSITLGVASLGIIAVPGYIVEPLIALSIVWIAVENTIYKHTSKWRSLVVFGFGLLHGLGFAAVLNEYGLPKGALISSLLAFNIGVEIGQISVILLAFAMTFFVREKTWYRSRVQIPVSIMMGTVGAFWFIERTLL